MHTKHLGIVTFLFLSLLYIPFSFSQTNFEGKIVFQVNDEGVNQQMSYLVKGSKFRIEPEGTQGQGIMLFDNDTRMMTILMPSQKMYMEIPMDNEAMNNNDEDETEYFVKTRESKEINGYTCDKFEFKDKDGEGVAWMTKELGGFLFFNDPKGNQESGWQKAITEEGYFPMEVYQKDASGSEKLIFKIVELKPMSLDKTLFIVPAGFKKLDMSGMMKPQK
ncbi:hypothetical protein BMS3Abin03_00138 [bacterium BMS3Abin03]|nr:hypothetical protein BMS3Abin03_00138 [bacterium BMS3Abin03]